MICVVVPENLTTNFQSKHTTSIWSDWDIKFRPHWQRYVGGLRMILPQEFRALPNNVTVYVPDYKRDNTPWVMEYS